MSLVVIVLTFAPISATVKLPDMRLPEISDGFFAAKLSSVFVDKSL